MHPRNFLMATVFWLLFNSSLFSQKLNFPPSFHIGTSFVDESLPEGGKYDPVILTLHFNLAKLNHNSESHFILFLEHQVGLGSVGIERKTKFESGINMGIEYRARITQHVSWTSQFGSGPAYFNAKTNLHQQIC